MKCAKCRSHMNGNFCDEYEGDEIICETCGAAYSMEYLGYYPEGSDDRIDAGFENSEWEKEVENIKNYNYRKNNVNPHQQ